MQGMQERDGLWELTDDLEESWLYNEDLAPTTNERRTWGTWAMASLWVGMSVCIPTYMLASGLIASGMTWWMAVGTILLGNLIVLVPMVLNGHAGTKFGVPFPVLLRSSFGTLGSNVPALLRAFVACGWFGIQTWIGGAAVYTLLKVFFPGWADAGHLMVGGWDLGLNGWEALCFLGFWGLNIGIILIGIESIKWLEELAAPCLLLIGLALLGWGIHAAGGLGPALSISDQFSRATITAERTEAGAVDVTISPVVDPEGRVRAQTARVAVVADDADEDARSAALEAAPAVPFTTDRLAYLATGEQAEGSTVVARIRDGEHTADLPAVAVAEAGGDGGSSGLGLLGFLAALTAMVGFWATLALNIPDFTRFAGSQRAQITGQAIGLPTTMTLFSFIGVAVTCASVVAFPDILIKEQALWDPVELLGRFDAPVVVVLSMLGLAGATLTTNLAANVVSPANDFSNLAPRWISFRTGGVITGVIGILIMPWKLLATHGAYIFTWLVGYGALLGPIAGILIADYWIVQRRMLKLPDLYRTDGEYGLVRLRTLAVLAVAVLPNLPGFLAQIGYDLEAMGFSANLAGLCETGYNFAWFLGFAIAFGLHALVGQRVEPGDEPEERLRTTEE